MERAVAEQQLVLFPRMRELDEARLAGDRALRGAAVAPEEWSPKQVPYKVYERDAAAGEDSDEDSDADSDSEEAQPAAATAAPPGGGVGAAAAKSTVVGKASSAAPSAARKAAASTPAFELDGVTVGIEDVALDDGLEIGIGGGIEEQGFVYKGPEPTLYGDWQHKGRCSDF